jgi:hypothetical protein
MAVCSAVAFYSTSSVDTRWWLWGMVGSCTEWDLENMVAGGWLEFGSSPQTAAWRGRCARHIVVMQDTIVSQFYHHFLPSSILPVLQNFDIKIRITVLSYRDTLMVLQTQVIYKQCQAWPAEILLPTAFSFAVICWCTNWKHDILSQDLSLSLSLSRTHARAHTHTHTHRMRTHTTRANAQHTCAHAYSPAHVRAHMCTRAHTHTHNLHGVCSVLIPHEILHSFAISSIIEHWSDIMDVKTLAPCFSFLDIAVVPLHTLSCSDFWPFFASVVTAVHRRIF